MAAFVRILGINDSCVDILDLSDYLEEKGLTVLMGVPKTEKTDNWTELGVYNGENECVMFVLRSIVAAGQEGGEELDRLREQLEQARPDSAAKWLGQYFENIRVIYSFDFVYNNRSFPEVWDLNGALNNFELADAVLKYILKHSGGIMQTDGDGYTNEAGDMILWQYEGTVSTRRNGAVLDSQGNWMSFNMDAADATQLAEFLEGKRPRNATEALASE